MRFAVFLLLLCVTSLSAAAPFTPQQEARIQEMVRETLVSHPDILAQAMDAWQQQNGQQQVSETIAAQSELLFHDPNSPRIGSQNPRLTLVLFTDYNCPYCKQLDPMLEKIVRDYPQVALIYKPLPFKGATSVEAARVALTAWRAVPQRFMALHQRLMAKKGFHDTASIRAAQQKSDTASITADKTSMDTLRANLQLAEQLGVQGTPATLVGDEMLAGAVPYETLESLVKQKLAQAPRG
ncbi:DsbA family protein [Erwinia sp. HR93]|uniref:DsbA family protein n=1 Tax=Erwinia sp. HR93 TaxID=3094840 RepID=UPI002ADEE586|nr:DsbA family protein [Erwinia sp. HR93]MEA1063478.1 DsbA family protein [Erwinia sp. HR93]